MEFGCKFKHEQSTECKFKERSKNNLCQYRHRLKSNAKETTFLNILEPVEKFKESNNAENTVESTIEYRFGNM